jgi:hypothetical protein
MPPARIPGNSDHLQVLFKELDHLVVLAAQETGSVEAGRVLADFRRCGGQSGAAGRKKREMSAARDHVQIGCVGA